jgi:hypothetical protein
LAPDKSESKLLDISFHGNKRNWTQEEDNLLLELTTEDSKHNWKKLAKNFHNKTPQQVSYRYHKLLQSEKKKWSRTDDITLVELVELYGKDWKAIAIKMPGRSVEDIKERFQFKLDPNLKRGKFEKEEDDLILQLYSKYGNQWDLIANHFNDRNALMIKNRFYSSLKSRFSETLSDETEFKKCKKTKNNVTKILGKPIEFDISNNKLPGDTITLTNSSDNSKSLTLIQDKSGSQPQESLNKSHCETYLEKPPLIAGKNFPSLENDFTYDPMMIEESFYTPTFSVSHEMPDLDRINLGYDRHSVSKVTSKNDNIKNDSNKDYCFTDVYLDETESNNIPSDLFKFECDSPRISFQKENTNEHFNEMYRNAFRIKKSSFEIEDEHPKKEEKKSNTSNLNSSNLNSNNLNSNNLNSNNLNSNSSKTNNLNTEVLLSQYKMLEDVFSKVKEVYANNALLKNPPIDQKILTINKKLDEKRENLSNKLNSLKSDYFNMVANLKDNPNDSETVKSSLISQIEILMELIKTTKFKISLVSNQSSPEAIQI